MDSPPHEHLVIVSCTIWTRSGVFKEAEIDKPTQARGIVAYTLSLPAYPPEKRARVLAYKLIMEEKELSSLISTGFPPYYKEYSKASKSIWDAKRNGSLIDLYSHYNKNKLHQMMLFPSCNSNEKERNNTATQNNKNLQGNIISEISRLIGQVSKTVTQQRSAPWHNSAPAHKCANGTCAPI
jgi:hypothetical protein